MENEGDLVRLLTEIRDNQMKQMEAQRNYQEWARMATAAHQRRALIVGILVGLGVALVVWASSM